MGTACLFGNKKIRLGKMRLFGQSMAIEFVNDTKAVNTTIHAQGSRNAPLGEQASILEDARRMQGL